MPVVGVHLKAADEARLQSANRPVLLFRGLRQDMLGQIRNVFDPLPERGKSKPNDA